ncbi:MAG: major capsid protein P2 [Ramlibacter sp.]|nr:major capsid protein P2 [Ramlibacter sp.]
MNQLKPCQAFQNVAASSTAIVDLLPTAGGNTLEAIWLTLGGGNTIANITAWRLKANGKTIRESTGPHTDTINQFYGYNSAATQLLIDFMFQPGRTPNAHQAGALELSANSGIKQLTLEVDLGAGVGPTMSAHVALSPAGPRPGEERIRFIMLKQTKATINVPAAGEFAIAIPHSKPEAGGSVFMGVHMFAANITSLRVRRQGIDEWTGSVTLLDEIQTYAKRVPQANHVAFDPVVDNIVAGRVWDTTSRSPADPVRPGAGVTSAEFLVTVSGAETFDVETLELIYLNDY